MEENVALESSKQKKFVKSIKGIKKLIKKNENEVDENASKKLETKGKKSRPERGLVYLSHIPHGFYEHQMTQYFKQFGVVTNVRVIRSKHTGNSKGHAFVEFKEPAVGQIVAETMNNYLMGKRLIKAAYIPPEKQRRAMRKSWSRLHNPGKEARLKCKKAYNENKDETGELKRARKIISNLNKTKSKLTEMGINYDFFTPVDVPEALNSLVENKQKEVEETTKDKKTKEGKKENKPVEVKTDKSKKGKVDVTAPKDVKKESKKQVEVNKKESKKPVEVNKKESKKPVEVNKKEQKQKQQKLSDAGVKPMANFIKINQESDDESDGSEEFDSDEFEKMLEGDDSDIGSEDDDEGSDEEDDDDDEESEDDSESEEEEITPPPKKGKGKKGPIIAQPPPVQQNKQKAKQPTPIVKRKMPNRGSNTKKPNFEKQTQQPMKKQFKKKK